MSNSSSIELNSSRVPLSKRASNNQLINTLFDHITAFEVKLRLWETRIKSKNFADFPSLSQCKVSSPQKYSKLVSNLRTEFAIGSRM